MLQMQFRLNQSAVRKRPSALQRQRRHDAPVPSLSINPQPGRRTNEKTERRTTPSNKQKKSCVLSERRTLTLTKETDSVLMDHYENKNKRAVHTTNGLRPRQLIYVSFHARGSKRNHRNAKIWAREGLEKQLAKRCKTQRKWEQRTKNEGSSLIHLAVIYRHFEFWKKRTPPLLPTGCWSPRGAPDDSESKPWLPLPSSHQNGSKMGRDAPA